MAKKSDKRSRKSRLSATTASRSFAKLLDKVESGHRFLIHRRGRDICFMGPPAVLGRRASECLAYLRGRSPVVLDGRFGDDLLEILAGEPIGEGPWWAS